MWALKEGLSSDALPHRYGEQKAKPKTARYGQQRTRAAVRYGGQTAARVDGASRTKVGSVCLTASAH